MSLNLKLPIYISLPLNEEDKRNLSYFFNEEDIRWASSDRFEDCPYGEMAKSLEIRNHPYNDKIIIINNPKEKGISVKEFFKLVEEPQKDMSSTEFNIKDFKKDLDRYDSNGDYIGFVKCIIDNGFELSNCDDDYDHAAVHNNYKSIDLDDVLISGCDDTVFAMLEAIYNLLIKDKLSDFRGAVKRSDTKIDIKPLGFMKL